MRAERGRAWKDNGWDQKRKDERCQVEGERVKEGASDREMWERLEKKESKQLNLLIKTDKTMNSKKKKQI